MGAAFDDRHEEEAPAASISDRAELGRGVDFRNALERAKAGETTVVDLRDGLGGGDANAGTIVTTGTGADDNGGEFLTVRKLSEEVFEWVIEIALLRTLAGEGGLRENLAILSEEEGGVGHAGIEGENPIGSHKSECEETINLLKLKNSRRDARNPCAPARCDLLLRI